MLQIEIDEQNGIAIFSPSAKLSETDFTKAASQVDQYIEKAGQLNGLIIVTESFPGWDSFSAMLSHLRFVKDHHRRVAFVAIVTDSALGGLAEHTANHFVSAKIKAFKYSELDSAKEWIAGNRATFPS